MFQISIGRRQAGLIILASCFVVVCSSAPGRAEDQPLKGKQLEVNGLEVVPLLLPEPFRPMLPCLLWADAKASAFVALEAGTGVLRRISFPDLKLTQQKNLDRRFSWMSLSAEGLVLSEALRELIWVVDPVTLEAKKKISVPKLGRATSAPGLSVAVVSDRTFAPTLYVFDLVKGTRLRGWSDPNWGMPYKEFVEKQVKPPKGTAVWPHYPDRAATPENPAMTPDGANVFTENNNPGGGIARFSFKNGRLDFEDYSWGWEPAPETSQRGNVAGITFSPDSKLVCRADLRCNIWNADGGTPIYPVAGAFPRRHCLLEASRTRLAIGFDPKADCIYTQNYDKPGNACQLVVFTYDGVKKKEFKWGEVDEIVYQYLVHPDGRRVIVLSNHGVYAVELPNEK
jgi:hypothetical protein